MADTKIEWCDEVWNVVTGCTKVSSGCKNCYAERIAARFWGDRPFTEVRLYPERLEVPLHWKKPRRVFVNSMSDLFHPDVPDKFIDQVFVSMKMAWRHTFIILTKRPERMVEWFNRWTNGGWSTPGIIVHEAELKFGRGSTSSQNQWPLKNVWLLTSVSTQADADKNIPLLMQTQAAVLGVSVEPLLENIDLEPFLSGVVNAGMLHARLKEKLNWVIVGGESGPNARPIHPDWARSIRDQCVSAGVAFYFKHWGEWYPSPYQGSETDHGGFPFDETTVSIRCGKRRAGRILDGRVWDQYPEGPHPQPLSETERGERAEAI